MLTPSSLRSHCTIYAFGFVVPKQWQTNMHKTIRHSVRPMLHAAKEIFLRRFYSENPLGNHISVTVLSCLNDCKPIYIIYCVERTAIPSTLENRILCRYTNPYHSSSKETKNHFYLDFITLNLIRVSNFEIDLSLYIVKCCNISM